MFSRFKSSSKNDLRGVFRSLFSSNDSRLDDANSNQSSIKRDKKNTFTRKLKTRLSSIRLSKRSQWKKECLQSNVMFGGEYHTISTPNASNDDLNVTTLSSILKTSKMSKSSMKKKLRFIDDNSKSQDSLSSVNTNQTQRDSIVEVSEPIPTDSDLAYYIKLKEELFERNKDIVVKSPLKRKVSSVSFMGNQDKVKKINDNLFYYPPISQPLHESTSETTLEHLTITHGICTYVSTCPPKSHTYPAALNEFSLPNFSLKKWPRDDDNFHIDEISNSSSFSGSSSSQTNECANNDMVYSYKECESHNFSGKISSFKKNNIHRFNPISKSCTVSLLTKHKDEVNRMSWCSA